MIRKYKVPVVLALLLTMSITFLAPATPAYAFSISDLLGQSGNTSKSSSGGSLIDILLGLLIGKLFSNIGGQSSQTPNVTLGASTDISKTNQNIIDTAKKYLGTPYVWGGMTPSGFDCSGYTQYVMKQNGISIPRTAAEQFNAGTKISDANLKVGDLVFFTTYKPGASHVGFYLGDRQFIHAGSGAKKVAISSLDESYYKERYLGARRYVQ